MFISLVRSLLVLSVAVKQVFTAPFPTTDYPSNAEAAFQTLQKWYNAPTGQYKTTGWWNSANCLTTIGDLAAVDHSVKLHIIEVLANSFVAAQTTNLQTTKLISKPNFMIQTFYDSSVPAGIRANVASNPKGFLNGYYDDEGWWALAWLQAYDLTKNEDYLQAAIDIFEDMKKGSSTNCGGIWWDKAQTYVNAIANELYLSVASHLATRASNKEYYLGIAQTQLEWFQNSGMINSENLINDGLTRSCTSNHGTIWTYNQGVILGGLVELNRASPNTKFLTLANKIAKATIKALGPNGILTESCEPNNCGADGSQFKGIFMRNLQKLQEVSPDTTYLNFISSNARSIWASDRNGQNELSVAWAGPFVGTANASTQSSALDALVAAVAFSRNGI